MAETSGDKLYLGFLLLVYFVIWVAVCSLWFKPVLLLQASIFAGFYLVSHAIGVFGRGKIGLSADGVQTLLLVPAFFIGPIVNEWFLGYRPEDAAMGMLAMAPAFLAGHVGAMLFTLLWSSAEENLKKEREQAAKRNNPYPD